MNIRPTSRKLKFKPGDRVRIRSLQWYLENKDEDGKIRYSDGNEYGDFTGFSIYNSEMCGAVVVIDRLCDNDGFPYYACLELGRRFGYFYGVVDEMLEPDPVVFEYCIEINARLDETIYYTEEEAEIALAVWKKTRPMDDIRIRTINLAL